MHSDKENHSANSENGDCGNNNDVKVVHDISTLKLIPVFILQFSKSFGPQAVTFLLFWCLLKQGARSDLSCHRETPDRSEYAPPRFIDKGNYQKEQKNGTRESTEKLGRIRIE